LRYSIACITTTIHCSPCSCLSITSCAGSGCCYVTHLLHTYRTAHVRRRGLSKVWRRRTTHCSIGSRCSNHGWCIIDNGYCLRYSIACITTTIHCSPCSCLSITSCAGSGCCYVTHLLHTYSTARVRRCGLSKVWCGRTTHCSIGSRCSNHRWCIVNDCDRLSNGATLITAGIYGSPGHRLCIRTCTTALRCYITYHYYR
jgi:hypothetical protein